MRFDIALLTIAAGGLAVAGCAATDSTRTCQPSMSWAAPAYTCSTSGVPMAEPEPEPEPALEPEPEPEPERVAVEDEQIELAETVQFETASATLIPESEGLLDEVVDVLDRHPELRLVQVEGHTDSQGNDSYNQRLSERRARAVKDYLVSRGIDEGRLTTAGYGEGQPIADNGTEEGRFENRRVELTILERD